MTIEDDLHGTGSEPITEMSKIPEAILVRGLSVNRESNGSLKDYQVWNDLDDMVGSEGIDYLYTQISAKTRGIFWKQRRRGKSFSKLSKGCFESITESQKPKSSAITDW